MRLHIKKVMKDVYTLTIDDKLIGMRMDDLLKLYDLINEMVVGEEKIYKKDGD